MKAIIKIITDTSGHTYTARLLNFSQTSTELRITSKGASSDF
jgi:hypothetical protein